jgi:DNA-binding IclR family transcriptional regulator
MDGQVSEIERGLSTTAAPATVRTDRVETSVAQRRFAAALRPVPAVERAVRLLDRLAGVRRPATLADLARELALPKSSLHGLLGTLVALELVKRLPDGAFTLGAHVLQWAGGYAWPSEVAGVFNELAAHDCPLAAETVMLAVLDGADVVYLACRSGTRPLAVNFRVGGRLPASCTASGKAMLATLPAASLRERLGDAALPRLTRHSIAELDTLLTRLTRVRAAGHAVDDEETAEGLQGFGAPVFAAGSEVAVAAVAVCALKASVTPARECELVEGICGLAARLSERLGAEVAAGVSTATAHIQTATRAATPVRPQPAPPQPSGPTNEAAHP